MNYKQLKKHFKSDSVAAKALGVTRQRVYVWRSIEIPLAMQIKIEMATDGKLQADLPKSFRRESVAA